MRARLAPVLLALLLAGCETAAYDPGAQPDVKTILIPQLDLLFPGSAVNQGVAPVAAVPMKAGTMELAAVPAASPLAPAAGVAC